MPSIEKTGTDLKIEVCKSERALRLIDGDKVIREHTIGLGFSPIGSKEIEGDGKTPEGVFYVCAKNPESRYHRSLCISYPAPADALRGLEQGLVSVDEHDRILEAWDCRSMPPQKTALGGEIYIHGHGSGSDWTRGCIALSDEDIEEVFAAVKTGTDVTVLP